MVVFLVVFLLLALLVGIGGAIEISLWFLLFLVLAAVAIVWLAKNALRR